VPYFIYSQEELHPKYSTPTVREIFDFIKPVFQELYVQHECLVMMLIYIERLMRVTGVQITLENWRPIVYSALLIASKVWEDICISNIDFTWVYPCYPISSTNTLESLFANSLHWCLYISPEEYSDYYFYLKSFNHSFEKKRVNMLNN